MATCVSNILKTAIAKNEDDINILYYPYNGEFEHLMGELEYRFFVPISSIIYSWHKLYPLPKNFTLIQDNIDSIPKHVVFDLIICNDIDQHYDSANSLAEKFHIPLIVVEHNLSVKDIRQKPRHYIQSYPVNLNKFTTEVISYGVRSHNNRPFDQRSIDLLIMGEFTGADNTFVQQLLSLSPNSKFINTNPLPENIKSIDDVLHVIEDTKIFISLMNHDYIPLDLLYSISYRCIPIVNNSVVGNTLLQSGFNGFVGESTEDIINKTKVCLQMSDAELQEVSLRCQADILPRFNYENFISKWENLITKVAKTTHIK